jgi:hypothetical protein
MAICQVDDAKVVSAPALPFYDWKACPFEGCAYREWTAQKEIVVYDTWKQTRQAIAQLSKGDSVTGVTGVVITFRPGVIRLDRDLPDQNLRRGDIILTYTYRGEGFSAVWFKGLYYSEFDISFARWPDGSGCGGAHCAATYVDMGEKVWWAEVKLNSGRSGWVNMDAALFDGVDSLASLTLFQGSCQSAVHNDTLTIQTYTISRSACGPSARRNARSEKKPKYV